MQPITKKIPNLFFPGAVVIHVNDSTDRKDGCSMYFVLLAALCQWRKNKAV
jgi:hypothetical protein